MTSPAYLEAALDRDLTGVPLGLYMRLYHGTPEAQFRDCLDSAEWLPLKRLALAKAMRVSEPTITRAIRVLLTKGYLERKRDPSGPRLYRLKHVRRMLLD